MSTPVDESAAIMDHKYTHWYICMDQPMCMYVCVCECIYRCIQFTGIGAYIYSYVAICMCVCTGAYMYVCVGTYIHMWLVVA